jgi:hypothetical protein
MIPKTIASSALMAARHGTGPGRARQLQREVLARQGRVQDDQEDAVDDSGDGCDAGYARKRRERGRLDPVFGLPALACPDGRG